MEPCRDQISKDFRAGTHQPLHPLQRCHQVMRLHAFIRPVDVWGAPLCVDFGAQPYSLREFSRAEYFGVDGLEPHTQAMRHRIPEWPFGHPRHLSDSVPYLGYAVYIPGRYR